MLNILATLGNANQNHKETVSHIHWDNYNKKTDNNKYWRGCEEIGTPIHCWWKYKTVQLL